MEREDQACGTATSMFVGVFGPFLDVAQREKATVVRSTFANIHQNLHCERIPLTGKGFGIHARIDQAVYWEGFARSRPEAHLQICPEPKSSSRNKQHDRSDCSFSCGGNGDAGLWGCWEC